MEPGRLWHIPKSTLEPITMIYDGWSEAAAALTGSWPLDPKLASSRRWQGRCSDNGGRYRSRVDMQSGHQSRTGHQRVAFDPASVLYASLNKCAEKGSAGANVGDRRRGTYAGARNYHTPPSKWLDIEERCRERRASSGEEASKGNPPTTLMIRNLPVRLTRSMLLKELDEFGLAGKYDFLYLPIDRFTKLNVGYAFVNFGDPAVASIAMTKLEGHVFTRHFGMKKIVQVTPAHIQGFQLNLDHSRETAKLSDSPPCSQPWVLKDFAVPSAPYSECIRDQPEANSGTDAGKTCIAHTCSGAKAEIYEGSGLEEQSKPEKETITTSVTRAIDASIPTAWRRTSAKHPLKPLRKRGCVQRAEILDEKPPPERALSPQDGQVTGSQPFADAMCPCDQTPSSDDAQDDWNKPVPCADAQAWPADASSPDRLTLLREYDLRMCYMCADNDPHTDQNMCQQEQPQENAKDVTTLVLCNLPSYYTKDALIAELEVLCLQDSWDFLSLPVDAATQWSVGCAYINCRTPAHANIARAVLMGHSWFQGDGHATAEVTDAVLQGYDVNVRHSRLTQMPRTDMYPGTRPVVVDYGTTHPLAPSSYVTPLSNVDCVALHPHCAKHGQSGGLIQPNQEVKTISIDSAGSCSVMSMQHMHDRVAEPLSWATRVKEVVEDATSSANGQRGNLHGRVRPSTVGTDSVEMLASPLGLEWPTLGA